MSIEAVFFDFYGTLYKFEDMSAELEEFITELHYRLSRYGLTAEKDKVWDYYNSQMWNRDPPKPDNGMTIFERRIEIACSDLQVTITRTEIEETAEALLAIWDKYAYLDPACIPLLDSLAKHSKIAALISNYDHPQHVHKHVRQDGLDNYLSAVIISGDHGVRKPDPRIFHIALDQTGIRSHEAIYVGDSEEDVIGANQAGLTSVLIDRDYNGFDYGQRYTIRNLREVLAFALDEEIGLS